MCVHVHRAFSLMKFRQLAPLLTLLLRSFGETSEEASTHFQEDCAGAGNLTAGVRLFHLLASRRDVLCQHCVDQTKLHIGSCFLTG